jgi:hypothetical protein
MKDWQAAQVMPVTGMLIRSKVAAESVLVLSLALAVAMFDIFQLLGSALDVSLEADALYGGCNLFGRNGCGVKTHLR